MSKKHKDQKLLQMFEKGFEHPLGEAILKGAEDECIQLVDVEGFEVVPSH